jgi:hypothetical protein
MLYVTATIAWILHLNKKKHLLAYFTSVNPSRRLLSAKTIHPPIDVRCLNTKTRKYLLEKAESSSLFLPTRVANSKTSDALLKHLTYLTQHCRNANLERYLIVGACLLQGLGLLACKWLRRA